MTVAAFHLGLLGKTAQLSELIESDTSIYHNGYNAAELRRQLVRRDLPSYIDRDRLYSFAKQVLDLSRQGLLERGLGEEKYLEPLYDRVNNRTNPANTMLAQLENGADIYDVVRSYAKIG